MEWCFLEFIDSSGVGHNHRRRLSLVFSPPNPPLKLLLSPIGLVAFVGYVDSNHPSHDSTSFS